MSDGPHGGHPHRSRRGGGRPRKKSAGRRRGPRAHGGDPGREPANAGRAEPVPADLPATEFEQFDLAPNLTAGIAALGYVTPSPIQAAMIPHVLDEKNVIGRAQTGIQAFS